MSRTLKREADALVYVPRHGVGGRGGAVGAYAQPQPVIVMVPRVVHRDDDTAVPASGQPPRYLRHVVSRIAPLVHAARQHRTGPPTTWILVPSSRPSSARHVHGVESDSGEGAPSQPTPPLTTTVTPSQPLGASRLPPVPTPPATSLALTSTLPPALPLHPRVREAPCSMEERRAAWAPRVPVSLSWTLDVAGLNAKSAHAPPDLAMSDVHVNVAGFRRDLAVAAPPPRGAYVDDGGAPAIAPAPPRLGEAPRDGVEGREDVPPPPPALTLPEKARLLVDAVAASASTACRQAAVGRVPPAIPQPLIRDGFAHITEGLPLHDGALEPDRAALLPSSRGTGTAEPAAAAGLQMLPSWPAGQRRHPVPPPGAGRPNHCGQGMRSQSEIRALTEPLRHPHWSAHP